MAMNEYEQLIADEAATRETPSLDPSKKNPYMDLVQEESLDTERAIGIAAQNAVQVQPDRRAEVMKLAERYRLSPDTADRQYDALKKLDFAEAVKPDRMVKKHPNLATWLSDPNNMAVSSDELDKLQDLSDTVNDRGDIEKFYNALGVGMARVNSGMAKIPALTVDLYNQQFVNPITKALGYGEFAPKEGLRNNAVTDYFDDAAKGYAANVPELDDQVIQTAMAGDYKKASRALAFQVASNFPQLAVTIGSAMMGAPQVGLAMMGGMSAAGEYDEALDNGVNPKSAMANAVVSGSAEAAFEKFGTLGILKKWEATMGKGLSKDSIMKIMRDTGKMLMISGAQEGAEEFGTSVVQDTSKVVTGVNPDLKLENIALNAGNSLLVGMGSGATMTSIGGMAYARQRNAEMNMVNENLMFLDAIGNKVKDLKLRKRLPKAAQQMVEQLTKDGPVENVYIKPEDFKTYFQSKNMDPLEAATLFGVGKEFQEASETGADIRVPLAKFVSNLVETEHYQGLKNSVKFNPDAMTYNEAQQEKEKTKADLKLIAKEAEQDEETVPTRIQQAREVKKVIKDRLLEMNNAMIGPNEADQYAVLHAQALSSLAEKSGMSPMDLLNRYGLKIQTQEGVFDVVPSQDVAMASQGQVLNQQGIKTYSEVVESARRSGNPDILSGSNFATKYEKNQKFAEQLLPVSSLYRGEETPSQVLSLEDGPQMNDAGELIGGDEFYAQKYSKDFASGLTAEPIIAHPDGRGGFEIVDGRHRARAAFLRGETQIRAFVPLPEESTQLFQSAAQKVAQEISEAPKITPSKKVLAAVAAVKEALADPTKIVLFNSASAERNADIEKYGIIPQHGSWVKEVAEGTGADPDEILEAAPELAYYDERPEWVFAQLGRAMAAKKGKHWTSYEKITRKDISANAQLSVLIIDRTDSDFKKVTEDGQSFVDLEGNLLGYFENEIGPEPGNVVTEELFKADFAMAGEDVIQFLKAAYPDILEEFNDIREDAPRILFQSQAAQAVADQFVEPASPTFSKLIQVVEQKMGGSANPQEIRAMLKEVKEEEKKWLGLEEFLAGKEKVKRQDLLDFLRANEPEIVDVAKGKKSPEQMAEFSALESRLRVINTEWNELSDYVGEQRQEIIRYLVQNAREEYFETFKAQSNNIADGLVGDGFNLKSSDLAVEQLLERAPGLPKETALQYIQNKTDARKLEIEREDIRAKIRAFGGDSETNYQRYTLPGGENYREVLFTLPPKPMSFEEYRADYKKSAPGIDEKTIEERYPDYLRDPGNDLSKDNYKSSHFDERNILAHVRLNDRVDADGKKVLFIEEIQSDLKQEMRKLELRVKSGEILSEQDQKRLDFLKTFPFDKTWHEYAMKRIVRMAAEGGYERIAWTTGQQQAERFKLSKHVKQINHKPAKGTKGGHTVEVYAHDGRMVGGTKYNVQNDELADLVGKEMADKIIAGEGKPGTGSDNGFTVLSDLDLEVGGDGMKGFYDKILVDYAKKFGKKFGATVGETSIRAADSVRDATEYAVSPNKSGEWVVSKATDTGFDDVATFATQKEANAHRDKLSGQKVHSLDVTDKMKEVALGQGFELFQSDAKYGTFVKPSGVDFVGVGLLQKESVSFEDAEKSVLVGGKPVVVRAQNGSQLTVNERTFSKTRSEIWGRKSKRAATLTIEEKNAATIIAKNLPSLIPDLIFDGREENYKKDEKPNVLFYRRYYGQVEIDGSPFLFQVKTEMNKKAHGVAAHEGVYLEYARKLETPALSGKPDSGEGLKISQSLRSSSEPSPTRAEIIIDQFAQNINTIRKTDYHFQSDASEADPRARIVISSNKTMRIDLFKKADLSSFLHETGHFYLEIIDDLVKDPRTSQGLKDDYEKIRTWLGAKPGEKLTVDQHEQWARGFELYLASGKAPSTELKRAFAHFKVWLTKIYTNLKNLNVELNDEIIGVMDRLVATDEQLQAALLDQQPLFENPLEMGMSPEQSEKYKKLDNDRKREASEKLTQEAIKSEMQKRQAAYKTVRKEVRDRIEKEANEMRAYRALSILQKGKMPDGSPLPEGSQKIKLDRDSIVRVYGKEFLETLPRPFVYTREGGVDFNIAAEMLGYQSGDELLKSIAGMPSKDEYVERETEREMKLRFPDEVMEEFPEQAIRAAHNESRGKMLYFELETLARDNLPLLKDAIKRVARRVPTEKEVRATARGMIAKKQMKEIRPSVFERAERKAAKEAGEALAKGDIYGAFEAKRRELLNFELYRAAVEAQELNEKALEFFKKFKGKDEDIAKTRDTDLVNVGRAILAQYGLGRAEKTPEQYLEMMKRYDQENYDSAIALIQNSGLVPGPYKEISFDEFSTMYETVKAIWDLAKSARSVEIDGVRMDKEQIKAELIGKINELAVPGNRPGYDKAVTDWDKTKMRLLGAKASLRRVESWVSAVDGDSKGIFRKYIWNPISEATAKYRIEKVKVLKQYQDLVQEWAKNSNGFQTPIVAENLGYTFGGKVELLGAILHTGNESNLEKLLVGRGWGQRLDDDTLDTSRWDAFMLKMYRDGVITKADMDFAQKVWDLMETLKPDAQRAHKAMYGFYFNEITANELITPFGIYRGGYVPAITDSVMVEDNAINQEKESLKQNNSAMYPTAGRGFTKSRVEQYAAPLAMDLKLVGSHIDKVLRFIHIEPSVKQVARVVMDKEFRANLANLDPVIGQDMLVPWLQRAAQQAVSTPMKGWAGKAIDTFAKELRKRSGLQTMFFNVTNTMQQVTGFTIAAVKVKPKYLRNALWRYIKAPKEFSDAVISKSKFMEGRSATQVMEVNKIIDELAINPTKFEQYRDFVQEHGYFLQSAAQGMVDMTVWTGAYEEAVERGESEKEATRFADSVVRETQGSMNPEDMSRFESGTALTRLFTMFYSYFNMQANLLGTEGAKTIRDLGLRKGAGRLLYVYTMGFMLPAWFSTLIVQAMGNGIDEDDDEQYLDDLLQSFFTSQFSTATAMFPIVGPIINRVALSFNDKPYDDRITLSPAISMIESAGGAPLSVYKAIADDGSKKKAVRDVMSAIGLLSGIPTGPIQRPLSYLVDVSEGEADPTGPIDFTRGLVTGKPGQVQ